MTLYTRTTNRVVPAQEGLSMHTLSERSEQPREHDAAHDPAYGLWHDLWHDRSSERGDVPGWVLITVMSAGLVAALWAVAGPELTQMLREALNSVG